MTNRVDPVLRKHWTPTTGISIRSACALAAGRPLSANEPGSEYGPVLGVRIGSNSNAACGQEFVIRRDTRPKGT